MLNAAKLAPLFTNPIGVGVCTSFVAYVAYGVGLTSAIVIGLVATAGVYLSLWSIAIFLLRRERKSAQ